MIIPKEIKIALEILNNSGNEAYIVGGAVRNYFLNKPINDYDITTSASPNTIKILFNQYNQYSIGEKLGTIVVLIGESKIDITTFRKDENYIDHRHPKEVIFTTDLFEDLKRRDFTINALCVDKDNNFVDLFDGINDLNNKIIKAIGDANTRFNEDALRILRAIKFASKLDFEIENNTYKALFANKDLLKKIANERKKEEFLQILSAKNKYKYINEYLDIFKTFINIDKTDLRINNLLDPYYALAYLLKDKKEINLKELKYSKQEINLIRTLISSCNINIENDYELISSLSNIYENEVYHFLCQLYEIDLSKRYKEIKPYIVDINSLDIKGDELMAYGLIGKQIKEVKKLLVEQIRNMKIANNNLAIKEYLNNEVYNK